MTGPVSHLLGTQGEKHLQMLGLSALLWGSLSLWQAQKGEAKERMAHRAEPYLQDCVCEICPLVFQPPNSALLAGKDLPHEQERSGWPCVTSIPQSSSDAQGLRFAAWS